MMEMSFILSFILLVSLRIVDDTLKQYNKTNIDIFNAFYYIKEKKRYYLSVLSKFRVHNLNSILVFVSKVSGRMLVLNKRLTR